MRKSKRIEAAIADLERQGRLGQERSYIQHGKTTIFEHSVNVAYLSLYLADVFHLKVDKDSLIRGALLHDYFLYDWHKKEKWHRLHGFRHPAVALKNAEEDYCLNEKEKNIILRHMFPLTICPPKYKEAWLVSLADKICTLGEVMKCQKR